MCRSLFPVYFAQFRCSGHLIPVESGTNDVTDFTLLCRNLVDDFGDPCNSKTPKFTSTREPDAALDRF